jgi:ketosteroid isomerase-like protein
VIREESMKRIVLAALFLAAASAAPAGRPGVPDEIHRILEAQVAAWNAGDLEGFMAWYWRSDDLTFQSGAQRHRGWQVLLDRYRRNYAGEKRGKLRFADLEVNVLDPAAVYVLGRWELTVGTQLQGGVFTIILKKLPQGWRIVHDHTS